MRDVEIDRIGYGLAERPELIQAGSGFGPDAYGKFRGCYPKVSALLLVVFGVPARFAFVGVLGYPTLALFFQATDRPVPVGSTARLLHQFTHYDRPFGRTLSF